MTVSRARGEISRVYHARRKLISLGQVAHFASEARILQRGGEASLENMYVTPKIFGVELDNLRQLLAYFIGIWRKTSAYQIRTFQYGGEGLHITSLVHCSSTFKGEGHRAEGFEIIDTREGT